MADDRVLEETSCADVRMFTKLVRTFQKADDNIVHVLNRPDARTTTNCSKLYENFTRAHERRKAAIERCIAELAPGVEELSRQAAAPSADKSLRTKLTAEQAKVRQDNARLRCHGRGVNDQRSLFAPLACCCRRIQLRHLQTELAAEEIVAEQTVSVFRDRCSATGLVFKLASKAAPAAPQ